MIERRIKELTIALEALSRINSLEGEFTRVNRLLDHTINEAEQELNKTKVRLNNDTDPTDDIPF